MAVTKGLGLIWSLDNVVWLLLVWLEFDTKVMIPILRGKCGVLHICELHEVLYPW